ncbi:FISUMP domain-containing protein [Mucilaginibacter lappiensis]|uniref:Uncharacterized protein (TIGR02145 family) n=1 Tax=Mucilaginibacter lappiensis TaxID=354630 RepID=A0A841JIS5_9SPHI|nr:FISUMP domain-containing protein [Mucilaginibacter lappiensis]MBB6130394.1 uncharacterized protein (TIGR02145 family) [Mucilaginibacter lappiensis]
MKKVLIMALTATALLFASCSKKSNNDVKPEDTNKVTINGTDYATTKIGTQTWTTVNYNGTGGVTYTGVSNAAYGKLYTLTEAKAVSLPTGWRLPTKADAEKLLLFLGATTDNDGNVEGEASVSVKLKSKSDWTLTQGNNSSGFNAYPAGEGTVGINSFDGKGDFATFWTSTTLSGDSQYLLGIWNNKDGVQVLDFTAIDYTPRASTSTFSIRFVRDN